MRARLFRVAFGVASLVGGCVALFLLFYDLHDFRPYLPHIREVYASMDPEDREPPGNVQSFVWKADGKAVDNVAARGLLSETHGPMRMSSWHYHSFMWYWMLRVHFSRTERLAFYCHYLPYERGRGFTSSANFYFRKLPDALSRDELATIVAVGRAPRANSPTQHPDRLEAAKKRLLSGSDEAP